MEIWKDIPGYENYYEVSDLGNVRSKNRKVLSRAGYSMNFKAKKIKQRLNINGYPFVGLTKNCKEVKIRVHQLVAMAFLNHKRDGHKLVVDHINNIKTDNRLSNLQILTNKQNVRKNIRKGTSKYLGVSWISRENKWNARITINGKYKSLGNYDIELDAKEAVENELKKEKHGIITA